MEFSLNAFTQFIEFTEFSDKKILKIRNEECGIETPKISCVRDRDDTTRPQTQITEQILILNPIHASVIPQIL